MKHTLLIIALIAPLAGFSQAVMTYESHGLKPGTVNRMQQTNYIAPGTGGENVVWDFSAAIPQQSAEGAHETIDGVYDNHTIVTGTTGTKFSYNCDSRGNVYEGFQDSVRTVAYDRPITKIAYPFTYGSRLSGGFDGRSLFRQANLETKMRGTYSSEADAFGTLILPTQQELTNVLRVKTVEKYVEETCSNVEIEVEKYIWYVQEYRYPVFVTWDISYTYQDGQTAHSQTSFYTLADIYQPADTPVYTYTAEQQSARKAPEITHHVYPNPFNAYFNLTYTLDEPTVVNIALYSLSGALVRDIVNSRTQNGIHHVTYSVGNEPTGVYYLRLQFGDKLYVRALVKE
ncbi:MAG: T9SS type A sorting domain-containing protein [Prevotellaceae bacterium]|jgi:hypothetical protein|nr:T9SS type A sorting domain-containing protein [Prevotellaceae bacterium]